jgi:hypothetical protein
MNNLRSKYLARLSQHQQLLKTKIHPEKYWGFVEHLKNYIKITGLDVELRKIRLPLLNKTIFKINLEIYFEKNQNLDYKIWREIFQLYFYDPHDVVYGQDFLHITMNEDFMHRMKNPI